MIDEQTREIQEMSSEFQNASSLMQEKYGILDGKFQKLQELYEGRPSRPEDLEMIKDLDEQIVQKDAFIKKQEDDMKFYKLELINREQSYNQMFGHKSKAINELDSGMGMMGVGAAKPSQKKIQL